LKYTYKYEKQVSTGKPCRAARRAAWPRKQEATTMAAAGAAPGIDGAYDRQEQRVLDHGDAVDSALSSSSGRVPLGGLLHDRGHVWPKPVGHSTCLAWSPSS
jgi:hypothetical protein